jgi:hypothetical protein
VRIDGPKASSGNNFFSASIGGRAESTLSGEPSSAGVGELAISSDGHAYAYSGNDNVPTFLASKRVKLGEWHNLGIVADFAMQTSRFYVDDDLLATMPFGPSGVYPELRSRAIILGDRAPGFRPYRLRGPADPAAESTSATRT